MSEDELSPTRGESAQHHSPPHGHEVLSISENDANSSIIGKVKSRVSSILPQTLTKWFSPSTVDVETNRNGNLRRRRDDSDYIEMDQNSDDSNSADYEQTPVLSAPPAKRSRLNINEGIRQNSFKESQRLRSSTPLTATRNRPVSTATDQLYINIARSRVNYEDIPKDVFNIDTKRKSLASHEEFERGTFGSRRSLNIPSTSSKFNLQINPTRNLNIEEYDDEGKAEGEEDLDEILPPSSRIVTTENDAVESDILGAEITKSNNAKYSNGISRISPAIVSNVDTASESGDSRTSSVNNRANSVSYRPISNNLRSSMSNGLNFYSHLEGRKSLFGDKNMSNIINNSTLSLTSLNRKQFNASIYGSTSALSDSRLLNTYSPFYKGPTTYGGAAAYSKYNRTLQQHSMRITPTLIRPTSSLSTLTSSNNSFNQVNNQTSTTAISSTAKRILDLINDFPTPLSDAKKMANNTKLPTLGTNIKRFSDVDLSSSRIMRLSNVRTPYSRPSQSDQSGHMKNFIPPTNELQVPSMSQLLQMKKLQSSTERARQIANKSKCVLNREEEYKLPTEGNSTVGNTLQNCKHVSKIKQKVTSTRISSKTSNINNEETSQLVNLPDISLPFMKSVPKIDIAIQKPVVTPIISNTPLSLKNVCKQSTSTSINLNNDSKPERKTTNFAFNTMESKPSVDKIDSEDMSSKKSSASFTSGFTPSPTVNTSIEFKFSSPIKLSIDEHQSSTSCHTPVSNFKFSPPVPVETSNTISFKTAKNVVPVPKTISSSKTSSVIPQLKSGSVVDALNKPTTVLTSTLSAQFKMPSSKWECSVCMICNDVSRSDCEACTTPREKKTENKSLVSTKSSAVKSTFGDAFKPKSDSWECQTCMIRNKSDCTECVACNTRKTGPVISTVAVANSTKNVTTDFGFQNIILKQLAKWECPACFTRNEPARNKCVCCEQIKPGSSAPSESSDVPTFSFGVSATSSSKFTFGFGGVAGGAGKKEEELKKLDSNTQEDGDNARVKGFSLASSSVVSEGFTFGSKPAILSIAPAKEIEVTKPTFTFGINTSTSTIVTQPGFKLQTSEDKKTVSATSQALSSSTSSVFKPIGNLAFNAPLESPNKMATENKTLVTVKKNDIFDSTDNIIGSSIEAKPDIHKESPVSKPEVKSNLTGFVFGQSATAMPATPIFGVTSSNKEVQETPAESYTPVFGFTGNTSINSTLSSVFRTQTPDTSVTTATATTVSSNTPSSFGSTLVPQTSNPTTSSSTNQFSFGVPASKSESAAKSTVLAVFGAPATSKTFTFGSSKSEPIPVSSSPLPFTFGSSAPAKQAEVSTACNLFGMASSTTSGGFGAIVASGSANSTFGATAAPSSSVPTFASFGSVTTSAQQTPAFGQTATNSGSFATPAFSSVSAPTNSGLFGSPASSSTFGSPGFSTSGTAYFGSVPTAPPTFGTGIGSATSDGGPAAKKSEPGFNFSSQSHSGATTGGFNFGSNNNNNVAKQAFNFTSSNAPSFNFTGSSEPANASQPFQFGAVPNSTSVFNFSGGVETTPNAPFQFNAANAANNMFAPTPVTGATAVPQQPGRRKIRPTTRRTTPR